MAEFKLGRIRFIWKGAWTTGTEYVRDDIVQYGGKTFICILAHTGAANLETDLNDVQPKWQQFGDGLTWEGDWVVNKYYKVNDIVRNGGYIYICNTGHTSAATNALGLEDDIASWDIFAEGISYTGAWSINTKYKVNDIAKYGGTTYICSVPHTSAATVTEGLEDNIGNWNEFTPGIDWKGNWAISTRYKKDDVVKYNGYIYICITGHTSTSDAALGLENDVANWNVYHDGVNYRSAWQQNTRYVVNDIVKNGPSLWICTSYHTSTSLFQTDQANWETFLPGLEFEDSWNIATVYQPGDVVTYGGYTYVAKTNHSGSTPSTTAADWDIFITGFSLQGDWDVATAYQVGDVVRVRGYTYLAVADSTGQEPPNVTYWSKLNEGFSWQGDWADATDYKIGDLVRYNDNAYVAQQNQTSDAASNRPDLDTLGVFWNLVGATAEENVLTTDGDLLYYSGAGPTRLPIGEPGQVLKVDTAGTGVEWDYFGLVDNVYYVSPQGVDSPAPAYGITSDRPWLTVAYACAQILNATTRVNAKYLLDQNIDFIAAETVEWVDYQIANAIAPFTGAFTYDKTKCLRDMKQIVKHVGYDISHGGNVETRKAAQSYFTTAGASYVAGQETETVAAINYSLDVVAAVLGNTPPATNYQTENSVATPVTQVIDVAYTAETDAETTYDALVAHITGAITAGNLTSLPAEQVVHNTLFVKTGTYAEALPISVPAHTAIVGDELRSTKITPDGSSLTSDMFYVRNGCGIRNCTLSGLTGTLGAANSYGTSRPSAGAYVSLDPGEGVDDRLVWIHNKSPYIQNVSTFGTACIGLKVDGDLHAGGNDSIVANDFTQILSDGIGYWVTNLGRSELVSVFTYYNHIGYLAENGGKIRATNGNNSYGDFGSVAEGIDTTETPITGTVNNYYAEAIINSVFTDGSRILALEYENAGVNYTTASYSFVGEGIGASVSAVNTRTNGIFAVQLTNPANNYGGADYTTALNNAQNGSSTTITISNTDTANSSDYIGMAIYIEDGVGVGQYAYIDTYNAGTKIATVKKMSDDTPGWDHLVPGTAIETTLDQTSNYRIEPRVTFADPVTGTTARGRAKVAGDKIFKIVIVEPGSGYDPLSPPTMTITDPNNTVDVPHTVRVGSGVLAQPTFADRGTGYETASADVTGDGYADILQSGKYVYVENLTDEPQPGANIQIANDNTIYKLVQLFELSGSGPYSARLQLSPEIPVDGEPAHAAAVTHRIRYSQVRLTGHDFLDIGTGNFANTNYPGIPLQNPVPNNETVESGGGRVFYTSTDQDGNFRVGDLFTVEQATGTATLDADNFSVSGLQELQLGSVSLGGTSATIKEFSTDGTFSADSDEIVPTQRAIRTYINSQIGGGAATLNVNTLVAGVVQISGNTITTTDSSGITIDKPINFEAGLSGTPLALQYFLNS
jgi:hypothetical protein